MPLASVDWPLWVFDVELLCRVMQRNGVGCNGARPKTRARSRLALHHDACAACDLKFVSVSLACECQHVWMCDLMVNLTSMTSVLAAVAVRPLSIDRCACVCVCVRARPSTMATVYAMSSLGGCVSAPMLKCLGRVLGAKVFDTSARSVIAHVCGCGFASTPAPLCAWPIWAVAPSSGSCVARTLSHWRATSAGRNPRSCLTL